MAQDSGMASISGLGDIRYDLGKPLCKDENGDKFEDQFIDKIFEDRIIDSFSQEHFFLSLYELHLIRL